jgi:hypothetical protein
VDTLLKGTAHFQSLGPLYPILMAMLTILFVIAMRTRSERCHGALAVFSIFYLILYPLTNLLTVQ